MHLRAATTSLPQELGTLLSVLLEMTKPRVTRLVLVTTALGGIIASGPVDFLQLGMTLLGTVLVVGAANVLNMFLEQDADALMQRTRSRPLPTGRISSELALAFGVTLAALGTFVLGQFVNELTCELAMMAFVSYVLVYTPLKAVSQAALYIGAVPGALPPLLGYAGQQGELTSEAWSLFAVLFAWQLPHFLAIAIFRKDEYAKAGMKVMPVMNGVHATRVAIIVLSVVLVAVSFWPSVLGLGGVAYAAAAALTGGAFLGFAAFGKGRGSIEVWARRLFFASMPHLVVLYAVLAMTAR